jgi:DNA-binding response OmpR family regulator
MKKITIIEDDRVTRSLIQKLLRKEGYIVHGIEDAEDLVNNVYTINADLVIADIMMPHVYDVGKLISIYQNLDKPIIVISSMDSYDGIYFTKKINGESFFQKPLDFRDLVKEVNDLLGQNEKVLN